MRYHTVIVIAHESDEEPVRFTFKNMTPEEAESAAREDFRLEWENDPRTSGEDMPEVHLDYIFGSRAAIEVLAE